MIHVLDNLLVNSFIKSQNSIHSSLSGCKNLFYVEIISILLCNNTFSMSKKKTEKDFDALTDEKLKSVQIPKDGFLGLLAYGDVGLVAWRKARGFTIKSAEQVQAEKKKRENE